MSFKAFFAVASLVTVASVFAASDAGAVTVERVVAVVNERPILLSELRHRAIPSRVQMMMTQAGPAGEERDLYAKILERMIDDRLEDQAAEKARINVTQEEIDRGLQTVASQYKMGVHDLLMQLRREGVTEQDYRDELRRQILEGKLIELRVRPRVRVTETDARVAYLHWTQEVAREHHVELHLLMLNVTPENIEARAKRLEEIVNAAKGGEDFCKLIANNSDDVTTRDQCGSAGPVPMHKWPPEIQNALQTMRAGDFSSVMHVNFLGADRLLVFERMTEPRVPSYEEVKAEMSQRAVFEALEHQRKLWLQELRRSVYIDVRL